MVRLESVSKSFDDVRAVGDFSLEIPAGEINGLLGPNGVGKPRPSGLFWASLSRIRAEFTTTEPRTDLP